MNSNVKVLLNAMLLTLCMLNFTNPVNAAMQVSDSIIVFEPGKSPRQDITVFNPDKDNMYVKVDIVEVKNPGSANEERAAITNPDDISLLITPNKMVVPPNTHKTIRLVNVKPPGNTDRIFRATITPVAGELTAKQSGIKLLIAYGLLIIVQPENPAADLKVTRTGTTIHFKNTGNTNTVLTKGKQCPAQQTRNKDKNKDKPCLELKSKRLYAGNEWTLKLPLNGPVEYTLKTGNKFSVVRYP